MKKIARARALDERRRSLRKSQKCGCTFFSLAFLLFSFDRKHTRDSSKYQDKCEKRGAYPRSESSDSLASFHPSREKSRPSRRVSKYLDDREKIVTASDSTVIEVCRNYVREAAARGREQKSSFAREKTHRKKNGATSFLIHKRANGSLPLPLPRLRRIFEL